MNATDFAYNVSLVADTAKKLGLEVPRFKSPCLVAGSNRAVNRNAGVVSISYRGRNEEDVLADIIAGVLTVNEAEDVDATVLRQLTAA